ncbi:hypothetical protein [Congregibacter sp.]|uniref:hypothetical protein n=1 Tax=Congregibacter sp. TaxID=2744308 RepID=UPI003F6CD477
MSDFFIARQPIFDQSLKLFVYALLFRSADTGAATRDLDDDLATAQALNISEEVGLAELVDGQTAFINLPRKFLSEPELLPFEPFQITAPKAAHLDQMATHWADETLSGMANA